MLMWLLIACPRNITVLLFEYVEIGCPGILKGKYSSE